MKITLFVAFVCLSVAFPRVRKIENLNNPAKIPGEFLVVLHAPAEKVSKVQYVKSVADKIATISPKITILDVYANLRHPILYMKTSDESIMTHIFQLDEVSVIECNLHQQMTQQCASEPATYSWSLARISARDPPDYTNANYIFNPDAGNGVRAYILDTGVRLDHLEMIGRAEFGQNFAGGEDGDTNGHGTSVAGLVIGNILGVSKAATVVSVKVLQSGGSGVTSQIIAGINWVIGDVQSKGVRGVINLSLGGMPDLALDSAVNDADDANIPVVVAAGNEDDDACNYSPGRAISAITVAETRIGDILTPTSNWGRCVNILAPGGAVMTPFYDNNFQYVIRSGTSFAAPHVTGLIANYLSVFPEASPSAMRVLLMSTATLDAIDLRGVNETLNNFLFSMCI